MKKLLIFAGTTEGRQLAKQFQNRYEVGLRVATEYGEKLAGQPAQHGRMSENDMRDFLKENRFDIVLDATHPYAREVSANIKRSCESTGTQRIRLLRQESDIQGCVCVPSAQKAAEYLKETQGRVLLTTGSKELDVFRAVPAYEKRLFVRVLPTEDSVKKALDLGYPPAHIIAMQGPFTKELNVALLRQFEIEILLSKDGGKEGGFLEKWQAAHEVGAKLLLITRPQEEGMSLQEVQQRLEELA